MKLILQTDGGARGNPGPAGAGVVLAKASGQILQKAQKFLGDNLTNNEAEYQALIFGLELVQQKFETKDLDLEIRLDSELVVKQLRGEYKVKEVRLKVLVGAVKEMLKDFAAVKITHVLREDNKLADQLANQAMDEAA